MHMRQKVVALGLLAAVGCASGSGRETGMTGWGPAQQEVLDLQRAWVQAALRGEADAFAAYMDDNFKVVGRDGRVRDKTQWVESIRSGQASYDSVAYHNVSVNRYGTIAVISGEYIQRATSGGRDTSGTGVFVATWVKRDDRWQVVASLYPGTPQRP